MSRVTNEDIAESLRYTNIMLEQLSGQNQLVLEVVTDMQDKVMRIPLIEEKVDALMADMKTVKAAVKDTNQDLHKLEVIVYGAT